MHDIRTQVADTLESLDATYRRIDIDPAFADTAAFCAEYGFAPERSANAILIASKRPAGINVVCLVLATHRLDVNHAVKDAMGAKKVSFASPEATKELTGMEIGGVTPFGLPAGQPILVDADVMVHDEVIVGGGDRGTKILVNPEVFARMPDTVVVAGLAAPIPTIEA